MKYKKDGRMKGEKSSTSHQGVIAMEARAVSLIIV